MSTFRNIERQSNPWGIASDKRMDWAEGLDVPTIEDVPDPEYILWVGCAGAFEDRAKQTTKAVAELLHMAGVEFMVLGEGETCNGDPARRAGNEFLFQMQAMQNVDATDHQFELTLFPGQTATGVDFGNAQLRTLIKGQ